MNEYVELKGGRMLEAPVTGGTGDFTLGINAKFFNRKGIVVYLEYQSVCPFVGIGSPHPLPHKLVCLPPRTQRGEEQHSLAGEGVVRPNSDDWKERLALYYTP
jgi:hypothetical protein